MDPLDTVSANHIHRKRCFHNRDDARSHSGYLDPDTRKCNNTVRGDGVRGFLCICREMHSSKAAYE